MAALFKAGDTPRHYACDTWTEADYTTALKQGWSVFSSNGSSLDPYGIEALDCPEDWEVPLREGLPENDGEAVKLVLALAANVARHALKAVEFLLREAPAWCAAYDFANLCRAAGVGAPNHDHT